MNVSTIDEEKQFNPRVGRGKTKEAFVKIMLDLKPAMPNFLQMAVSTRIIVGIVFLVRWMFNKHPELATIHRPWISWKRDMPPGELF